MFTKEMMEELLPESGEYKGSAKLSFQNPSGSVDGTASIKLSASGRPNVRINVESHSIPPEYHGMLMAFLKGGEPQKTSDGKTKISIGGANKVGKLEVVTTEGTFRSDRTLMSGGTFHPFSDVDESFDVMPFGLELVTTAGPEEMWCAPLLGDFEEFRNCANAVFDNQVPYIRFAADGNNCGLVIFKPPEGGGDEQKFNAALFGCIGNRQSTTPDEVAALIPWGLLAALSFAIGSNVEVPWIEIRGGTKELRRRVFVQLGGSQSEGGFPAFSKFDSGSPNSGIAEFIRCFCALTEETRHSIAPTMTLVRRGTPGSATVDECITDLTKALDASCKRNGFDCINLLKSLDVATDGAVNALLGEAREKLKGVRRASKTDGRLDQLAVLDKIISRQANVATDELDFGIAVSHLLHKFSLLDDVAMNKYYSTLVPDITWEGLLSFIRGEVVHAGAIHVQNRQEIVSWFELCRHLHDICKRVILREIGYCGTYSASNVQFRGTYALDRVSSTTTPLELGYTVPPVRY